jgi:predicted aldo/keto reductase-like oxidoreductase
MNSDNPDLLKRALDMGITHLDTAFLYLRGNSERMIGKVLEETGKRDKVIVATKMRFNRDREKHVFLLEGAGVQPAATEAEFNKQLETSLGRLRTDYIDILYLHSCYSPAMATFEPLLNALVKAKKAGKARFIGMSTHRDEPNVIRAAVDTGAYDVVLTAYNYLQKHREEIKNAIQYAAGKDIGVVAMKTQGGRRLQEEQKIEVNHKAALKWVLNDKNVCTAIPGITTHDQLALDFSVMQDLALTKVEKWDLNLTAMLSGTLFCQNCRTCIPSCPQKVEIPTLMRAYMYAQGYGNQVQAQLTTEELPPERGLAACRQCASCTASCPNGIIIGRRVKTLLGHRIA